MLFFLRNQNSSVDHYYFISDFEDLSSIEYMNSIEEQLPDEPSSDSPNIEEKLQSRSESSEIDSIKLKEKKTDDFSAEARFVPLPTLKAHTYLFTRPTISPTLTFSTQISPTLGYKPHHTGEVLSQNYKVDLNKPFRVSSMQV